MKSLCLKSIALCAALTSPAFAAGPYDGVYQYGLNPAYYSVHQSGNQMIVASLGFVAMNGVGFTFGNYQVVPNQIGYWEYSSGTVTGNKARIAGTGIFGSCVSTSDVTFESSGNATVTLVSYANTSFGTSQGVNCASLFRDLTTEVGTTITLRKIF
jgi:hypothetical protein